jgi:HK97 family phage major capsid protein
MDNWKDLLGQADALFSQAKAILSDTVPDEDAEDGVRPATDDEKENVMQMMEDARRMKEKALQLQHIDVEGQEIARASASTKALTLAQEQNDEVSELTNADANHPFKSWGEYLYTVFSVSHNIKTMEGSGLVRFDGDAPMSTKDMAEGAGATGGFLVPVEFQAQLQAVMAEETSIRGRCTAGRDGGGDFHPRSLHHHPHAACPGQHPCPGPDGHRSRPAALVRRHAVLLGC